MKKITLVLVILTFSSQAQTFPNPYCQITNGTIVEEITSVDFDTNSITNTDTTLNLIDATSTVINVTPEETYSITVNGNTYGTFSTNIVAFIDWNQNNILDDDNEVYAIGTLFDTDGNTEADAVTAEIVVPSDATAGNTRIRITKTYTDSTSPAIVDPCAIAFNAFGQGVQNGYGQAIDFTLNISSLSINEFNTNALSVSPTSVKDFLNIAYNSEINSVHIINLIGQEVISQQTTSSHIQLNLTELARGIYVVNLNTTTGKHNFKILKQ